MSNYLNQRKSLFYGLSLLFALWGILGLLDIKNYTYLGYNTDGAFTVIKIKPDSPAEKAGMQVGDYLKSIDGVAFTDLDARDKLPRPVVGQNRSFVVDRDGTDQNLTLIQAAQPNNEKMLSYVASLLGFIFLLAGLWIFSSSNSKVKMAFSFFAVLFGLTFMGGPYVANEGLRRFVFGLSTVLFMLSFPFLIKFLLEFPPANKHLENKTLNYLVFLPAIIYGALLFGLNIFLPDASEGLLRFVSTFQGIVILFYFVWALWLLIKKYQQSSPETRQQTGLTSLLTGAIIGLLPLIILIAVSVISPKTVIPGADYVFLVLAAIPILFSLGIKRLESTEVATNLQMGMA